LSSLVLGFLVLTAAAADTPDPLGLASLRGKVVLVDFWASWCEPCRHSFPWLNEMQAKYADRGLVVIGVNVDRERAEADRFLHDVPAQFRIVYDSAGTIATHYDLPGMPVSYVIGANGEVVQRHVGFRAALRAEREAELQKLLEKTQ
jgi:thiol-disulfide isomerase/thioredoxin